MTDPERRQDGPYELPIGRLAAGSGGRRQATIALVAIALTVGGAIGLARVGSDGTGAPAAATASAAARASAGSRPPASAAASGRSAGPRVEKLIAVANAALPGSPHIVLVERDGLDLDLRTWAAGAAIASLRTFHDALDGVGHEDIATVLAPTDDRLVVFVPGRGDDSGSDAGRLVDPEGRVLWRGTGLLAASGAAWSADGRLVAIAGNHRTWHLIRIDDAGRAIDRPVALPFRVYLPTPLPKGDLAVPRVDPRTIPLGFSADGRWAYGGIASAELGLLVATFRVAVDGSVVEPVADLGVGRSDGLVPRPGTIGGRLVDPVSGRIATARVNANTSGGPPAIEVRNPDAGFVFAVGDETPLGNAWATGGDLYILSADAPIFANRIHLVRYGPDGTPDAPLLELGPLTSADLLGATDGFAALAETTTRPDRATQLLLVDLLDPSLIAGIPLAEAALGSIVGVEIRP